MRFKTKRGIYLISIPSIAIAASIIIGLAIGMPKQKLSTSAWEAAVFPLGNFDRASFEAIDGPFSPDYASISSELVNTHSGEALYCGGGFKVAKLEGGVWKAVPFKSDPDAGIAYALSYGESHTYAFTPDMLSVRLDDGKYRLIAEVWLESEPEFSYIVWAEFDIASEAAKKLP